MSIDEPVSPDKGMQDTPRVDALMPEPSTPELVALARQLERELAETSARAVLWAGSKGKIWAMYENCRAELEALRSSERRMPQRFTVKLPVTMKREPYEPTEFYDADGEFIPCADILRALNDPDALRSATRRSESGESFLGENDYRELLQHARAWLDVASTSGIQSRDDMNLPTPNAEHCAALMAEIDALLSRQYVGCRS